MKRYEGNERTYGHILQDKAQAHPDRVFLYYKDLKITYGQLDQTVNRVANGLRALGVKHGDKVCIMLPNCPEFIFVWWALARIGAIEVPINTGYRGELLTYTINNCEAGTVVLMNEYLERLIEARDDLGQVHQVIVHGGEDPDWRALGAGIEVVPLADLYNYPSTPPDAAVKSTDLVSIMYTSGTTGAAKGIMRVHNHDYAMAENIIMGFQMSPEDVYYTCLPYFHGISQFMVTLPSLVAGGSVAMSERFSAGNFWSEIRRYRASLTFFIGSMLHLLYRSPAQENDADNPLRFAFAAPLPADIHREFERRFSTKLTQGYGSTETNFMTYASWHEFKLGAIGKAHRQFDVKIFDENDNELPANALGEIVGRPKEPYIMMMGYYNMPEETLAAFRNLWYHTGDLGYRDEDGYFHLVGRKKDAIRRRGENISAYDVERIVNLHPAVKESAAVGVPSDLGEEDVKIVVALEEGAVLSPQELVTYCRERMAYFMVPRYIEIRDCLPKTATEKIEKYKLREEGVSDAVWDRERLENVRK